MTEELKNFLIAVLENHISIVKSSVNNTDLSNDERARMQKDIEYSNDYLYQLEKIETFN